MKAVINRKDLESALKAIKKTVKKKENKKEDDEELFLRTRENTLEVISNYEYKMTYIIPCEDSEPGLLKIKTKVLSGVPKMRTEKLTLQNVSNTLKINGGSKVKIYCSTYKKDELIPLKVNENFKKIKLKSAGLGIFQTIIKNINFKSKDIEDDLSDIPVLIESVDGKFTIYIADSTHSVFYLSKEKIFKTDFEFLTYFKNIKNMVSLLCDDTIIYINNKESKLYFKSSNLFAEIPSLQIGDQYIKNAIEFMKEKNTFVDGKFVFSRDSFRNVLDSIGVIREEGDTLKMKVKGKKAELSIKSIYGESRDVINLDENSLGNKEFAIPLLMFEDVLFSASAGDEIFFRLSNTGKAYKIDSKRKNLIVRCLAPIKQPENEKE